MYKKIQDGTLCLTVDTLGAQMMSLRSASGTEFLWQGDPEYWQDRAPTLFPAIGRLTNNSYSFHGTVYNMGIHGFAAASEFEAAYQTENSLCLVLKSNCETRKIYPFDFTFSVTYTLQDTSLEVRYSIENRSKDTMPFGIGGHPGFRVPLKAGEKFEDYVLEFAEACRPDRIGFTPAVYLSGKDEEYPLEDGRRISLRHDLFDEDAIILKNMCREVTLRSKVSGTAVNVRFPQMPYLGFWHWPKTDAPYVCIEPWSSLPARQDIVEEISCKSDLIHLESGKTYENAWTISITEGKKND